MNRILLAIAALFCFCVLLVCAGISIENNNLRRLNAYNQHLEELEKLQSDLDELSLDINQKLGKGVFNISAWFELSRSEEKNDAGEKLPENDKGFPVVTSLRAGGAAHKAGILKGTAITSVNGVSTKNWSFKQIVKELTDDKPSQVIVGVQGFDQPVIITREEAFQQSEDLVGVGGIGIVFSSNVELPVSDNGEALAVTCSVTGYPVISDILPGSAAHKAGIKAKSSITKVDGQSTEGWTAKQLKDSIRGEIGETVSLEVQLLDEDRQTVELVREAILPPKEDLTGIAGIGLTFRSTADKPIATDGSPMPECDDQGHPLVYNVTNDSPADRAGLKYKQAVTHVDGQSVQGWSSRKLVDSIRGKVGTRVKLTIKGLEKPVTLTRESLTELTTN